MIGPVAANGQMFIQRSNPNFLQPGEAAYNIGSTQFLNMYGLQKSNTWTTEPTGIGGQSGAANMVSGTTGSGYLDLSSDANQVVWADTWVWVATGSPNLNTGTITSSDSLSDSGNYTYGPFRAAPSNGDVANQANPYRLWINGVEVGQTYNTATDYEQTLTHPDPHIYNPSSSASNPIEDTWDSLTLNVGWNHLVFQFDTSVAARYTATAQSTNPYYAEQPYWEQALQFKFLFGNTFSGGVYCQNTAPTGNDCVSQK